MRRLISTVYRFTHGNTARVVWALLVITALVLGSGAPLAFGGGSGGGG